jgi:hypothetical protein
MSSTYLKFKTPHYSFQMEIIKNKNTAYNSYHFIVGDKQSPCLEGSINLENTTNNERYRQYEYTASLTKIDALTECSLEDTSTEYQNKYSFGKELLDTILFFINSQFPQIKNIKLTDMSFIPCNRKQNDILDLLSYSIALYGKTWYEKNANAYFLPKEKYEMYRNQVKTYMDKKTKTDMKFEYLYNIVLNKNVYAKELVTENYEDYKIMFEESETFPEFFSKINKIIKYENKCRFFKVWLYDFIASQIMVERDWYIDLFPKVELITKVNYNKTRNKTRKNRNSKK